MDRAVCSSQSEHVWAEALWWSIWLLLILQYLLRWFLSFEAVLSQIYSCEKMWYMSDSFRYLLSVLFQCKNGFQEPCNFLQEILKHKHVKTFENNFKWVTGTEKKSDEETKGGKKRGSRTACVKSFFTYLFLLSASSFHSSLSVFL